MNNNIKNLENIFSDEAKNVLKQAASVKESVKEKAEVIAAADGGSSTTAAAVSPIKIISFASDNIINKKELETDGFSVIGNTSYKEEEVTVSIGNVTKTVKSDENGDFTANFSANDLSAFKANTLPEEIKAEVTFGGAKYSTREATKTDFSVPTATINSLGGDGVVNVSERDGKLLISGTSDAGIGGTIKVKLLSSNGSEITAYTTDINNDLDSNPININSSGSWSYNLPATSNFPTSDFKVQVVAVNVAGNEGSAVVSNTFPVDFDAPTATVTNATANSTVSSNVTYKVTFDQAVNYFTANSVTVTGGSVSSLTGSGTTYTLVVAPNSDSEEKLQSVFLWVGPKTHPRIVMKHSQIVIKSLTRKHQL